MATQISSFGLTIVILGISFVTIVETNMIMMTNVTCNVDTAICLHNICRLTPIRKRIQFLDFSCYFEEKQDNLIFRLALTKLGNGGRKIVDSTEDFCKVTAREGTSTSLIRIFPSFEKHGTIFSKCPLQGNITLIRYPVDFSFVPAVMTPGNYILTGIIRRRDSTSKLHLLHADIYFTVRNIFKKN